MAQTDPKLILSPAEMAQMGEDSAYAKITSHPLKSFLLAVTAGAFIAMGFIFFVTVSVGAGDLPWGMTRLVGGIVFSSGLMLVVLTGAELFTGSTLSVTAILSNRISWGQMLRNWGIVYVGNFLGALAMVGLTYLGGTWRLRDSEWGAVALGAALPKVQHTFIEAIALGILCNMLVCMAIWLTYAGRTVVDKIAALTLPIALFVATGFEHSVANMFAIPLGVLVNQLAPDSFWTTNGLDPAAFTDLTWSAFWIDNLLPVTIGNIIGGAVMIGVMYWLIFARLSSTTEAITPPSEEQRGRTRS